MLRKQKIAIIGTNGLPAKYGGFETLANYLTKFLKEKFDIYVYCSRTSKRERLRSYNNAKLIYLPFKANGYQSVLYDIFSIIHAWFSVDKLLILGNSGALIFPLRIFIRKRIILNIGGLEWRRGKWNFLVKRYIQFSEWLCVKLSDIVITDNKYLQFLCKRRYGVDSILIEYGGDHALNLKISDNNLRKYNFLRTKYVLSVSRAQSDNNIHLVLKAFEDLPEHILVIISNWNTSKYGRKLKEKYEGVFENIILLDAIYDQQELDVIRSNACLYVHSHSFCGTAPSLVEAMNLRLPIICFNTETNVETTENKSVYFNNERDLIQVIRELGQEKLENLRNDMYEIALRRYQWSIIAEKYSNCLLE